MEVKKGDTFKIGEICPESGVYRLKNCGQTSCDMVSKDQITIPLTKGEKFPPCKSCGGAVVWKFDHKA